VGVAAENLARLRKKQERELLRVLRKRGTNDLNTCTARVNLANTLSKLGAYGEARELLMAAIVAPVSKWDDHRVTIRAEYSLTGVLWELGERDAACQLLERVVKEYGENWGSRDAGTAGAMFRLAMWLIDRDRFTDAQRLVEEFLALNPIGGGVESVSALQALSCLCQLCWEVGRFDIAQARQEELVSALRRTFGDKHRWTIRDQMMLATLIGESGDSEDAVRLGEPVLARARQMLGDDYTVTNQCKIRMARLYHLTGRVRRANELLDQALCYYKVADGVSGENRLGFRAFCADTLYLLGKYADAKAVQQEILDARLAILSENEPDALRAKAALGRTLCALGELQDARALQEQVLRAWRDGFGDDYFRTFAAMQQLSTTFGELHELSDATLLADSASSGFRRAFGDQHRWTLEACKNLEHLREQAGHADGES
jgi:tetratricopeptide (TPR) repeat protein